MGFRKLGEKREGVEKYKLVVLSHGDVKYNIGSTVSNIIIPICGIRWVLKILGGYFVKKMVV